VLAQRLLANGSKSLSGLSHTDVESLMLADPGSSATACGLPVHGGIELP
jgi:hypothetical protein